MRPKLSVKRTSNGGAHWRAPPRSAPQLPAAYVKRLMAGRLRPARTGCKKIGTSVEDTIARVVTFLGVNMNGSRSGYSAKTSMADTMDLAFLRLRQVVPAERAEQRRSSCFHGSQRWFCAVGLAVSVVTLASSYPAGASHAPTHKSVGSYDVNVGVVSAAQAQLSPSQMGSAAHGEAARRGDYHLVVSMRDVKSGQVVANATIRAQVGPLGMSAQTKSLDAMIVNGEASYGNYFAIPGRESYTVHLWIEGSGASAAHTEAVFTLRRK